MKTNKEILDALGFIIVRSILDRYYKGIKKEINGGIKNVNSLKFNEVFDKLNNEQKLLLQEYFYENINSIVFDFLGIFEENEDFKLIYEEGGNQVDLVKISEMLKAEPIIENGWIQRFSKEIGKGE